LIGWSYGSTVAGKYAAENPDNVHKLILLGAMHAFPLPVMTKQFENKDKPGAINPALPAYQVITPDAALHHWHMMAQGRDLFTPDTFAAVRDMLAASDPTTSERTPPAIRRPMGPLVDLFDIWNNRPLYDATKIKAPTLVIYGRLDIFAEVGLATKLTGSKAASEIAIPEATHWFSTRKAARACWMKRMLSSPDDWGRRSVGEPVAKASRTLSPFATGGRNRLMIISTVIIHDTFAHSHRVMVERRSGVAMSEFQASQQASTISS
jgi:pimeloyl-ACP methyl ester carboxylesterase